MASCRIYSRWPEAPPIRCGTTSSTKRALFTVIDTRRSWYAVRKAAKVHVPLDWFHVAEYSVPASVTGVVCHKKEPRSDVYAHFVQIILECPFAGVVRPKLHDR
jgi:hypothetical protein